MKRKLRFKNTISILIRSVFILLFVLSVTAVKGQGFDLKTIVIDPGHGGKDPGATGKIAKEKDITLKVSLLLGSYIEKYMKGVKVVYTRKTDKWVDLRKRPTIANDNDADLFVSIHVNALGNKNFSGASTWTLGRHKTQQSLDVAKLENKVLELEDNYEENYQGFDPNSPDSYIIFSMMQNAFSKQSISLAEEIQHQFTTRVGRRNYGVHQAGFWVLAHTSMPAVLVELGFITNAKEERFLASKQGQEFMASAIFRAIRSYKEKIEAQTSVSLKSGAERTEKVTPNADAPIFKLQFLTSSKPMDKLPRKIRKIEGLDVYKGGQYFKYTIGESKDLNEIRALKHTYENDFPDAFIVAFKNGKRIPTSEALKEINQ